MRWLAARSRRLRTVWRPRTHIGWRLEPSGEGTMVSVTAAAVPPGIDQAAHEAGIASSLANLASYVEKE